MTAKALDLKGAERLTLTEYEIAQITRWLRAYDQARTADDFGLLAGQARTLFAGVLPAQGQA